MVVGDIVEDLSMVRESEHETVLKVGMFNTLDHESAVAGDAENDFDEFSSQFDLVVHNDGSLLHLVHLLENLFESQQTLTETDLNEL